MCLLRMDIINTIDVYKYAKENDFLRISAVQDLRFFVRFFQHLKINIAVEIGTYQGIGAAYFTQFANKVHTFDITDCESFKRIKIWNDLGVENKISFYIIKNRNDIKKILENIKFDFAFIDGKHTKEDVRADWELVKNCGRVLFHDTENLSSIGEFVESIGGKLFANKNLGYWENKGD